MRSCDESSDPRWPAGAPIEAEQRLGAATRRIFNRFVGPRGRGVWADMDPPMKLAAETKRLDQLTDEEYFHLCWHALCWFPDQQFDVRYFLPRMLADLCSWDWSAMSVPSEMVCNALRRCRWKQWKAMDVQLIENWFAAWWDAAFAFPLNHPMWRGGLEMEPPEHRSLGNCLKLSAYAGIDVWPRLSQWREDASIRAGGQLAALIDDVTFDRDRAPRRTGWDTIWGTGTDAGIEPALDEGLSGWIFSTATRSQLENAFFKCDDSSLGSYISVAVDRLEMELAVSA